jgi:hypothetical protein
MNKAKDIYMYVLGAMVVIACFFIGGLLVFYPIPTDNKDALYMCLGLLIGYGGSVINYFFGSSKSSADKTEIMAKQNSGGTQ